MKKRKSSVKLQYGDFKLKAKNAGTAIVIITVFALAFLSLPFLAVLFD